MHAHAHSQVDSVVSDIDGGYDGATETLADAASSGWDAATSLADGAWSTIDSAWDGATDAAASGMGEVRLVPGSPSPHY